jgi:RimJ/RimL family protein N-acetyltransferase
VTRRLQHAELEGQRVTLVPVDESYAPRAFDYLRGNDAILRWLVWDGPERLADLQESYRRWVTPSEQGDNYHFAILERSTGTFLGCIGPRFAGHPETGDVGYWLAPEFAGRGFMQEALLLVDHLAFRHLGASTMSAFVFVGNLASRRVLEKNGYELVHLAKGKVIKRGEPVDEWYFALLRHDFERRFADFAPRCERIAWEVAGG